MIIDPDRQQHAVVLFTLGCLPSEVPAIRYHHIITHRQADSALLATSTAVAGEQIPWIPIRGEAVKQASTWPKQPASGSNKNMWLDS